MAITLRQSTASQEVPLGYFVDKTDGDTAEDSLTVSNTDIKIWVPGATTLADKNSGGATHISGGIYYAVLDATDTATLGTGVIFVHESGALIVKQEFEVVRQSVYDKRYGDATARGRFNGTVAASAAGTVDLGATADGAADDYYNEGWLAIYHGVGRGQVRWVSDFTDANNRCTITPNWVTAPDTTSKWRFSPVG
jgi:hypothetical protein